MSEWSLHERAVYACKSPPHERRDAVVLQRGHRRTDSICHQINASVRLDRLQKVQHAGVQAPQQFEAQDSSIPPFSLRCRDLSSCCSATVRASLTVRYFRVTYSNHLTYKPCSTTERNARATVISTHRHATGPRGLSDIDSRGYGEEQRTVEYLRSRDKGLVEP